MNISDSIKKLGTVDKPVLDKSTSSKGSEKAAGSSGNLLYA